MADVPPPFPDLIPHPDYGSMNFSPTVPASHPAPWLFKPWRLPFGMIDATLSFLIVPQPLNPVGSPSRYPPFIRLFVSYRKGARLRFFENFPWHQNKPLTRTIFYELRPPAYSFGLTSVQNCPSGDYFTASLLRAFPPPCLCLFPF